MLSRRWMKALHVTQQELMLGQTFAELPAVWGLIAVVGAAMGHPLNCTEGGGCRAHAVHGCSSLQTTQDTHKQLRPAIFLRTFQPRGKQQTTQQSMGYEYCWEKCDAGGNADFHDQRHTC